MSGGTTISTSETKIEALKLQSSAYGVPITVTYGVTRLSGNLIWYNGFKATAHTSSQSQGGKGGGVTSQSTTYTYSSCVMMGLCEGTITDVPRIWKGKTVYTSGATTALAQLGLSVATGAVGQATWSYLTTNYPAQAIAYSGMAYVYAQDYALDNNASLDNHSFEVQGFGAYAVFSVPDANPATVAADILTNARYGAGYPSAKLASMSTWSDYCLAANIMLSPGLDTQVQVSEVISNLAKLTNTAPIWTTGGLKMVPYGDTAITGNGATYTPNLTPIYDLTDDDFIPGSEGADPIQVDRSPQSDAFNSVKVEFLNRVNYYNVEVATAQDSANIDAYGMRLAPTVQAHWICDAVVAQNVAQLVLQRLLYIRNTYRFNLPWTKVMLEPMDLVTLTDSGLGFSKLAVRLVEVGESDAGDLDVTAEDFTQGIAHASTYAAQASAGFQHNYAALPGSVSAPVIFEAPVTRTLTGLEVYAAVRGAGANWGGCRVWVSLDGTNYKDNGFVYGGARYGTITGAVSAGNLPVQLAAGQLISGSAADAANLSTLCYVGGAVPEYLAYQTATLTGASAYTLSGLNRNAFGTNAANTSHTTGDAFVRVDDAIAKSGPLDLAMLGKTIYLKFTSFNIYNASEESLANVTAYGYTVTGSMLLLPPSNVTDFANAISTTGVVKLSWNDIADPDRLDFEIRVGAAWASATRVTRTATLDYQLTAMAAGTYTFWIAARDVYLNYSLAPLSQSVVISAPSAPTIAYQIVGSDEVLTWTIPTSGSLADRYEIRFGASWAAGTFVDTTKATGYRRKVDYSGARTYWIAAIDSVNNYGSAASIGVNITVPGAVAGVRTDVVDNNVLIYWSAPAAGTLPVVSYEVRKGATWASGTVVGSNGNSTFAAVFEQQSGTYTYWIAAIDSVGNYGAPASTSAFVNQPPDYILRANINSTLAGSLVNAILTQGTVVLPVNTTETWTQHFANNGYATPQAQITAGYPIYINPSLTSASYTEVIDYGSTLPATNVVATLNSTLLSGTVGISCQINYSNTSATGPWTTGTPGATAVLATNFRWVQVIYTFTATVGANLLQINGLNVKLSVKQRTDSGTGAVAVAATGAAVTFGYPFISADTPIVQPNGATPLIPVVVYVGGVNPTGFTVFLYTLAGALTTGSFSWSVRGY